MSDNATAVEDVPELSDEDIALLHQITTLAQSSTSASNNNAPFRALFAAYDGIFAEQGLDAEHDGVVFRFLLRVGETARERGRRGESLDLVGCLKSILQAHGITVIEEDEGDGISEVTREVEVVSRAQVVGERTKEKQAGKRRVSFNDAGLDETWLSERSRSQPLQRNMLAQPARRGRILNSPPARRARSISSQRPLQTFSRQSAPKDLQPASPSTVYTSDYDDRANPTLLFQPSQTQLEQNAEAFASTSAIRTARRCLHAWHDRTLVLYHNRRQAYSVASAHDRRTLQKQAFDQWRTQLTARKDERALSLLRERQDELATFTYNRRVMWIALSHWATSATDQRAAVALGLRHMLRFRYFHRWRTIAVDNALKVRSILARKYLIAWREKLTRRRVRREHADAVFEESCVKRCWRAWFWQFCSRRVEGWREDNVKRHALTTLQQRLVRAREQDLQATQHYEAQLSRRVLRTLRNRLEDHQQNALQAEGYHDCVVQSRCLDTLAARARLEPLAKITTLKVQLNLQRKALKVWHIHLSLTQQAAEVDRKRVLQSAWTNWNDALRCQALGQKMDERVLVECLYKWVLQERLQLFRRTIEGRVVRQVASVWRNKTRKVEMSLQDAEVAFYAAQQRRRLVFGMTRLHLAMRRREDADRAAVEFASVRVLPNALSALDNKLREVQQLDVWAADARFYTLSTRTLRIWRERTTDQQHARRREAYATVRARIKIRLVSGCLAKWREKVALLRSMDVEAEQRAHDSVGTAGARAFGAWRQNTANILRLEEQATSLDRQRLMTSAFSAITLRYTDLQSLGQQADAFRHDTEAAVLAVALKKLQWAQFTAARRAESAEALWARNRDAHVRNMLRTWAVQTASRRSARQQDGNEEPESPSLRPASRAASRPSLPAPAQQFASSPPAIGAQTPAYMRTPSRSRRVGRFRPLPTPAAFTPFAFEQSYLSTTPAPLPGMAPGEAFGDGTGALTPQVTPFARKLRAGGFPGRSGRDIPPAQVDEDTVDSGVSGISGLPATPAPAAGLRSSVFGVAHGGGTTKSVRFAGASRFGGGHLKSS